MTKYNTHENKNALIAAVNNYASDLDDLFVADNLRMLATYERAQRMLAERTNTEYTGTKYAMLAENVASEMEGTNGGSWQFSTGEVLEWINEA